MLTRPEWGYEKRSKTVMSMLTRLILFFILFLTSQLGISAMSTFTEYQYDVNHTVLSEGIYDYDTTSNPRYSHLVPLSEKTQDRSFLAFVSDFLATKSVPKIKWGQQEKHFPGHNNYTPGRSTMTSNPEKLAQQAGTGQQVGKIPVGTAGSKERVNFGENIGTYIDRAGNASPTSKGIIHDGKDGIHIVPSRP